MAIINTLFMTKTAEKPYPLVTYIAHIREYPPRRVRHSVKFPNVNLAQVA